MELLHYLKYKYQHYLQCIVHREHLIAKKHDSNVFNSLDIIIKCINKIKRNILRFISYSLYQRIFKSLCEDYNEDYDKLLLGESNLIRTL